MGEMSHLGTFSEHIFEPTEVDRALLVALHFKTWVVPKANVDAFRAGLSR